MVEIIGNSSKSGWPVDRGAAPRVDDSAALDLDKPGVSSLTKPRRVSRTLRLVLAATFVAGIGVGAGATGVIGHIEAPSQATSTVALLLLPTEDQYRLTPHWELDTDSSTSPPTQARISVPIQVANTGPRTLTVEGLTGTGVGWAVHTDPDNQAVAPSSSVQLVASLSLSCPTAGSSRPLTAIPVTITVQTADRVDRKVHRQLNIAQMARQSTLAICTDNPPSPVAQDLVIPTPGDAKK